jgi:hypothetical protein
VDVECIESGSKRSRALTNHYRSFLRYRDHGPIVDRLTDLCISLESLIDSQTEISFRFSTCLARLGGIRGTDAESASLLLKDLYNFRSKVLHGDPAYAKLLVALEPRALDLSRLARKKLVHYFLFLAENSKSSWKEHLSKDLFSLKVPPHINCRALL